MIIESLGYSLLELFAKQRSCKAIAQDIFESIFSKDPRGKNVWNKYRREVLKFGGSHTDNLKMFENFLGRQPNLNALSETVSKRDTA